MSLGYKAKVPEFDIPALKKRYDQLDSYEDDTVEFMYTEFSKRFYGVPWIEPDYGRVNAVVAYYEKILKNEPSTNKTETASKNPPRRSRRI